MLIRLGFDIQFDIPAPVPMVALFHVHNSRRADLREPDEPHLDPAVPIDEYEDTFGNVCTRFVAPAGIFQISHSTLIEDSGVPDPISSDACQVPSLREELPPDALRYLLASRYWAKLTVFLNDAGALFWQYVATGLGPGAGRM